MRCNILEQTPSEKKTRLLMHCVCVCAESVCKRKIAMKKSKLVVLARGEKWKWLSAYVNVCARHCEYTRGYCFTILSFTEKYKTIATCTDTDNTFKVHAYMG